MLETGSDLVLEGDVTPPAPDPLRIALTVDPYLPVPPRLYGGIERVVEILVRGLIARGHRITLFAHPESRTAAELVPYGSPPHRGWLARARELGQLSIALWRRHRDVDVIHSFGRLAALAPLHPLRSLPKIQSYQRPCPWPGIARAQRLAGSSIRFTACATHMYEDRRRSPDQHWSTIFNAVDLETYDFVPRVGAEAPLVFLGRLEPVKGPHHAIAIAREAGRRLWIAGNRVTDSSESADYFEKELAPRIDGEAVRYLGPVNDEEKNGLLGQAAALLMPIEWEEPFGIVVAESLACGTPVIGFARGSLPEILRDGRTGFLCRGREEAVRAVERLGELDRSAARKDAEERFSSSALVSAYEGLYRDALEDRRS